MNLFDLPKIVERRKKRLGQGLGSGKGKTGGRGSKGRKARGKVPLANVGGGLIWYKKMPFKRGWGNRKVSQKSISIKLSRLNNLKANTVVSLATLIENKIVTEKEAKNKGLKILADSPNSKSDVKLNVALRLTLPTSQNAVNQLEKAGGKLEKN